MLFVRLFLIAVISIGTYLTLDVAYASAKVTAIEASPIPEGSVSGASVAVTPPVFDEKLDEAVEDALAGSTGTYAVVVKDLTTGATYTRNADHVFTTASLYKLWTMGETYRQIADGTLNEETKLSYTVEALNKAFDIASESAELTEGGFDMTVAEALREMITVSHNYAAYMLTIKIKTSNVKSFLEKHGLRHSNVGPEPKSTASDIALFFEKLYRGELGTPEHTQNMLDLLAGQKLNDRIPKYLPKDITVMHKTGELNRVKHDAGIVSTPTGDYLIVLMSDSSNQLQAAERLANISKNVYEYMDER